MPLEKVLLINPTLIKKPLAMITCLQLKRSSKIPEIGPKHKITKNETLIPPSIAKNKSV